ncbi:hypothetical protein, partial [Gemmiger formicilis]|uniref:hypothetical protein n=1 Tax=Gemmiger formicilis TaxID=745368 RepID=UPI001FAFF7C1
TECEVDAICDGTDFLVPGIMEQIERTGVHSGDSICVYLTFGTVDILIHQHRVAHIHVGGNDAHILNNVRRVV